MINYAIVLVLVMGLMGCAKEQKQGWGEKISYKYGLSIYRQLMAQDSSRNGGDMAIVADNITDGISEKYAYQSLDTIPNWVLVETAQSHAWYGQGKAEDVEIEYLDVKNIDFTGKD